MVSGNTSLMSLTSLLQPLAETYSKPTQALVKPPGEGLLTVAGPLTSSPKHPTLLYHGPKVISLKVVMEGKSGMPVMHKPWAGQVWMHT